MAFRLRHLVLWGWQWTFSYHIWLIFIIHCVLLIIILDFLMLLSASDEAMKLESQTWLAHQTKAINYPLRLFKHFSLCYPLKYVSFCLSFFIALIKILLLFEWMPTSICIVILHNQEKAFSDMFDFKRLRRANKEEKTHQTWEIFHSLFVVGRRTEV